jgi:hypothetical protein
VLLHEAEDAEDPPHPGFTFPAVDGRAQRADVSAGPSGLGQKRRRARRRPRGPIVGVEGMAATPGVVPVLAQEIRPAALKQAVEFYEAKALDVLSS